MLEIVLIDSRRGMLCGWGKKKLVMAGLLASQQADCRLIMRVTTELWDLNSEFWEKKSDLQNVNWENCEMQVINFQLQICNSVTSI